MGSHFFKFYDTAAVDFGTDARAGDILDQAEGGFAFLLKQSDAEH